MGSAFVRQNPRRAGGPPRSFGRRHEIRDLQLGGRRKSLGQAASTHNGFNYAQRRNSAVVLYPRPRGNRGALGAAVRSARETRFEAVLERGEDQTFDARLIKLVLG